jgi:hypothetical protein
VDQIWQDSSRKQTGNDSPVSRPPAPEPHMAVKWLNFLLYEAGWLACVLGAATGRENLGTSIAAALVGLHLLLASPRLPELRLILLAALCGLCVDGVLIHLQVLNFPNPGPLPGLPPCWMTVLWMQFASTLRYCLNWLRGQYLLAAGLALVGAPAAFLGGARLGAVTLASPALPGLLLLGVLWAAVIPLLVWLSTFVSPGELTASYRWPAR